MDRRRSCRCRAPVAGDRGLVTLAIGPTSIQMDKVSKQIGSIDKGLTERRTLEGALADLTAKHTRHPRPELARMIQQLEAEIAIRKPSS